MRVNRLSFALRATILAGCVLPLTVLPGCTPPAPGPGAPATQASRHRRPDPVGRDAPLAGLFQALDTAGTSPVTILQIGDSHTANDSFSGEMRARLQARFGNAGRGYLQPAIPFNYYRPAGVTVQAGGFTKITSFSNDSSGPFGIAAVRAHADGPAEATLQITDATTIGSAFAEFITQPGGGTVQLVAPPAAPITIPTAGNGAPLITPFAVPTGATSLTVRALGNGPVDWMGWELRRAAPGVIYANLGYPGASVDIMDRWDWNLARQEIALLRPAMIVLAYGTNEGFKPSLDPAAYAAGYAARLAALHDAAPYASILVLGPPDGQRQSPAGTRRHPAPPPPPGAIQCGGRWYIPPHLGQIRAIEQNAALNAGAYWFDWSAPQGGACGMMDWSSRMPPLGGPDHVHMKTAGYALTADVLFDTLMHGFDHWRATTGGM